MGQCSTCETSKKEKMVEKMYKNKLRSKKKISETDGKNNMDGQLHTNDKPNVDEKININEKTTINEISSSSDDDSVEIDTDDDYEESDVDLVIVAQDTNTEQKIISGFKEAVQAGNESLVMYHVEENPSLKLLDIRFPNGDSSLHVAVSNKSYNLIIYLLSQGLSPNIRNNDGETAIHTATRTREIKCVALLSKHNADISIKNNKQETALMIASENGDEDIFELLSPVTQTLIDIHIKKDSQIMEVASNDHQDDISNLNTTNTSDSNITTQNIPDSTPTIVSTAEDDKKSNTTSKEEQSSKEKQSPKKEESSDDKHDEKSMKNMEETRISQTNPFSKIKRKKTQKTLISIQNIVTEEEQLPKLQGWLEKKKRKPPYQWQKRWVIVKDSHFLWSDKQITIQDPTIAKERAKFNGHLSLMAIIEVKSVIKSKKQRKFTILAKEGSKNKTREYLLKATSQNDRDYWVKSLKIHINHMKELMSYLGSNN